jgi:hypothetical protein
MKLFILFLITVFISTIVSCSKFNNTNVITISDTTLQANNSNIFKECKDNDIQLLFVSAILKDYSIYCEVCNKIQNSKKRVSQMRIVYRSIIVSILSNTISYDRNNGTNYTTLYPDKYELGLKLDSVSRTFFPDWDNLAGVF